MHIFFFHLFPDLDTFAPIVYKLHKNKQKVKLVNLNIFNNYEYEKLVLFLKSKNIEVVQSNFLNIKGYFFKFLFLIIDKLQIYNLKIIGLIYRYAYFNLRYLSKKKLKNFLILNNTISINIDEGLVLNSAKVIESASKELSISVITHQTGFDLYKVNSKKPYIIDYYMAGNYLINKNKITNLNKNNKSFSVISFGCLRYFDFWLNELEKIYDSIYTNNNKLKILFFTRPSNNIFTRNTSVIKKVCKLENVDIIIKDKPRQLKSSKNAQNEILYSSSQLIKWADIIISHSSSIIAEVLLRNKPYFFLKYLSPNNEISFIEDYNCVNFILNENHLIKIITDIQTNRENIKKYLYNKDNYLDDCIYLNSSQEDNINSAIKFYRELRNV